MTKKKFFKLRTTAKVRKMEGSEVYSGRNLVKRIMELDPDRESLRLRFRLTPSRFGTRDSKVASRKNLRHGQYLELDQPYAVEKALRTTEIPLELRQKALEALSRMPEHENFCLGYSYRATFDSSDKTRIYVPFWSIMDGCMRDTYDQTVCKSMPEAFGAGSEVEFANGGKRVSKEGLTVVVRVPSSTEGEGKYRIKWTHVPVEDNIWKRVACWKTRPGYGTENPDHEVFNIKYMEMEDLDDSDFHMIYPQDVHASHIVIRHFMRNHNLVPFERSQIAIPSKVAAEYWGKLCNNIVIWDPSLSQGKGDYRHLHLDEKSMLQARQVGVLGPEATMYWDVERDGKIGDYKWRAD